MENGTKKEIKVFHGSILCLFQDRNTDFRLLLEKCEIKYICLKSEEITTKTYTSKPVERWREQQK